MFCILYCNKDEEGEIMSAIPRNQIQENMALYKIRDRTKHKFRQENVNMAMF